MKRVKRSGTGRYKRGNDTSNWSKLRLGVQVRLFLEHKERGRPREKVRLIGNFDTSNWSKLRLEHKERGRPKRILLKTMKKVRRSGLWKVIPVTGQI